MISLGVSGEFLANILSLSLEMEQNGQMMIIYNVHNVKIVSINILTTHVFYCFAAVIELFYMCSTDVKILCVFLRIKLFIFSHSFGVRV